MNIRKMIECLQIERTPLQQAAKRVYDDLLDVSGHLYDLRDIDQQAFRQIDRELQRTFDSLAEYMHEDDCDE